MHGVDTDRLNGKKILSLPNFHERKLNKQHKKCIKKFAFLQNLFVSSIAREKLFLCNRFNEFNFSPRLPLLRVCECFAHIRINAYVFHQHNSFMFCEKCVRDHVGARKPLLPSPDKNFHWHNQLRWWWTKSFLPYLARWDTYTHSAQLHLTQVKAEDFLFIFHVYWFYCWY